MCMQCIRTSLNIPEAHAQGKPCYGPIQVCLHAGDVHKQRATCVCVYVCVCVCTQNEVLQGRNLRKLMFRNVENSCLVRPLCTHTHTHTHTHTLLRQHTCAGLASASKPNALEQNRPLSPHVTLTNRLGISTRTKRPAFLLSPGLWIA